MSVDGMEYRAVLVVSNLANPVALCRRLGSPWLFSDYWVPGRRCFLALGCCLKWDWTTDPAVRRSCFVYQANIVWDLSSCVYLSRFNSCVADILRRNLALLVIPVGAVVLCFKKLGFAVLPSVVVPLLLFSGWDSGDRPKPANNDPERWNKPLFSLVGPRGIKESKINLVA